MRRIKNAYLITVPGHGCVAPSLRTGPFESHPAARTTQSGPSTTRLVGLAGRSLLRNSHRAILEHHGGECARRCAFGRQPRTQIVPAGSCRGARRVSPMGLRLGSTTTTNRSTSPRGCIAADRQEHGVTSGVIRPRGGGARPYAATQCAVLRAHREREDDSPTVLPEATALPRTASQRCRSAPPPTRTVYRHTRRNPIRSNTDPARAVCSTTTEQLHAPARPTACCKSCRA